jgi:MFS family permease
VQFSFILTGFGLLLCSSFLDSLRGPLLPVLGRELGLNYEEVSLFLVVGYLAAMGFGRLIVALIDRYPFHKVAAALCLLAPVTAVFSFYVAGLGSLVLLGMLVACTSASVGSTANLFILEGTEPLYRSRFYGLLHSMYGLGSQAAPLALGFCLSGSVDWRWLLVAIAVPILLLGAWMQWGLKGVAVKPHESQAPRPFRWASVQGLLILAFSSYVAAEVLCSMWMVAYLVEVQGYGVEKATPYATGFFVVMMLTRLGCYWLQSEKIEAWIIRLCLPFGLGAFVLGLSGWPMGFALVGLIGPYFPLVLARISRVMPLEAPGLTLRILIVVQGVLAACHFGVGTLASTWGVAVAYRTPVFAFASAIALMHFYFRWESQKSFKPAQ